jgi:TRAP-type uncharacterized transport system fused permease subunit
MTARTPGVFAKVSSWIAVAMALYHLYTGLFGAPEALLHRAIHLLFTLILIFMVYPGSKEGSRIRGFIFMGMGVAPLIYLFYNYDYFITRYPYVHPLSRADFIMGILLTLTLLEGARRSIGLAMPITAVAFIIYAYIGPYMPGL